MKKRSTRGELILQSCTAKILQPKELDCGDEENKLCSLGKDSKVGLDITSDLEMNLSIVAKAFKNLDITILRLKKKNVVCSVNNCCGLLLSLCGINLDVQLLSIISFLYPKSYILEWKESVENNSGIDLVISHSSGDTNLEDRYRHLRFDLTITLIDFRSHDAIFLKFEGTDKLSCS